jgi:predicted  nucleic acid-binding Zn-ribbon protein
MPTHADEIRRRLRNRLKTKAEDLVRRAEAKRAERDAFRAKHLEDTDKRIAELETMLSDGETLLGEIGALMEKVDDDLALEKLSEQRRAMERTIDGWKEAKQTLENHRKELLLV